MRDFYLFDGAWGIFLSILISMVLFGRVLIGAFREVFKAFLILAASSAILATLPANLVWLWDVITWIDYDIVFIAALVLGMILFVVYRLREQESEQLIYGVVSVCSFFYIVGRVAYIHFVDKGEGLLRVIF